MQARASGFRKSLEKYKYYMQLPFYSDGLRANDGVERHSNYFICVEKTPPYLCAVYDLDDPFDERMCPKEFGRMVYKALLLTHADCVAKNEWKGYEIYSNNSKGIIPISLNDFEFGRMESHPLIKAQSDKI